MRFSSVVFSAISILGATASAYRAPKHANGLDLPFHRLTMLIKKLDNTTSEEFESHISEYTIPNAKKCKAFTDNVHKFTVTYQPPELRQELADAGYPVADYDGILEFWFRDIEHFKAVTSSDCWQTVRADATSFTNFPNYVFMYGREELAFDRTRYRTYYW